MVKNNKICIGCTACMHICKTGAITIIRDKDGFYIAKVDKNKCVKCGMCQKVCPIVSGCKVKHNYIEAYAATSKDRNELNTASSGGMFSNMAKYIINSSGVVYGCAFWKKTVKHMRISKINEIEYLKRSKYVQSYVGETFKLVKKDLEDNVYVLYVGTPCQIAGLKLYLGKEYEKLFCIDIICHGVPSALMFEQNLAYLENKRNNKIINYEFRLKNNKKSKKYQYTCTFENGNIEIKPYYKDAYYEAFYNCKSYCEQCYECKFASPERVGDLTIGDYFWAKSKHNKIYENTNGKEDSISCVLINTEKGKKLFRAIKEDIYYENTEFDWLAARNHNLMQPTNRPKERDNIYLDIEKMGYDKWAKKYFRSIAYLKNTFIVSNLIKLKNKIKDLRR